MVRHESIGDEQAHRARAAAMRQQLEAHRDFFLMFLADPTDPARRWDARSHLERVNAQLDEFPQEAV
jgi:hypothetical protein